MIGGAATVSVMAASSLQAQMLVPAAAQPRPAEQPATRPVTTDAAAATDGGTRLAPDTALRAQTQPSDTDRDNAERNLKDPEQTPEKPDPAAQDQEGADGLTPAEERQVQALRQRDAEVRRHEQAHAAAGGAYAGAPQYEYTTGPDGRRYAIGGHVIIDTGTVAGDPAATIAKLQTVKRAALAPGNPSPQDRRVAAQAEQEIAQARVEQRQEQAEEAQEERESRDPAAPGEATGVAGDQSVSAVAQAKPAGDITESRDNATGRVTPNEPASAETNTNPPLPQAGLGALLDLVV